MTIAERLEYLRGELRAERMSYGELAELQGLVEHIDPGDIELLEAAGVPEFPESDETAGRHCDQCGKSMNPAERMLGPVCGKCCRANHKAAVLGV